MSESYPGIAKAFLEMCYDNGGINRFRTEKEARRDLRKFIEKNGDGIGDLAAIDAWLGSLTPDDLQTVCGEESEQIAVCESSPAFTHTLLDALFNEVV
jgi:hypothetical protein